MEGERLRIAENLEYFRIVCPHCGSSDVWSLGTIRTTAKAKLFICEGRFGGPDWDYDDHEDDDDMRSVDDDYEHDTCWCGQCRKSFIEPDIVPISEEEKAVMNAKQLEREGQQLLFKGASDERNKCGGKKFD